jgi:hypothetical protein
MSKKEQIQPIELVALYTICVSMINTKRISIMDAVLLLKKAGLTTSDYDTWYCENKRKFNFPIPFPTLDLNQFKF